MTTTLQSTMEPEPTTDLAGRIAQAVVESGYVRCPDLGTWDDQVENIAAVVRRAINEETSCND